MNLSETKAQTRQATRQCHYSSPYIGLCSQIIKNHIFMILISTFPKAQISTCVQVYLYSPLCQYHSHCTSHSSFWGPTFPELIFFLSPSVRRGAVIYQVGQSARNLTNIPRNYFYHVLMILLKHLSSHSSLGSRAVGAGGGNSHSRKSFLRCCCF